MRKVKKNFDVVIAEVLPLVEFFLEDDISDDEAMQLLESEPPRRKAQQDGAADQWKQERSARILVCVWCCETGNIYFLRVFQERHSVVYDF